jgi:hypothetical protein
LSGTLKSETLCRPVHLGFHCSTTQGWAALADGERIRHYTQPQATEPLAKYYWLIAVNPVGALSMFTATLVVTAPEVMTFPFASFPLIVREKEWLNPKGSPLVGVYVKVNSDAEIVELTTVFAVVSVRVYVVKQLAVTEVEHTGTPALPASCHVKTIDVAA